MHLFSVPHVKPLEFEHETRKQIVRQRKDKTRSRYDKYNARTLVAAIVVSDRHPELRQLLYPENFRRH